jgi:anti-anti-sigma factor
MRTVPATKMHLPKSSDGTSHRSFLRDIKKLMQGSRQPRLVFDLSEVKQINPQSIDLLLQCVDQAERSDGEVSVVGVTPETAVILELTQAATVLNVSSLASEAADSCALRTA